MIWRSPRGRPSRHSDVHQHDVGLGTARRLDRLDAVLRLRDDAQVGGGLDDHSEPGAHERLVVGDQDPELMRRPAASGRWACRANPSAGASPVCRHTARRARRCRVSLCSRSGIESLPGRFDLEPAGPAVTNDPPAPAAAAVVQRGLDHAIADQIDPGGEVDGLTLEAQVHSRPGVANRAYERRELIEPGLGSECAGVVSLRSIPALCADRQRLPAGLLDVQDRRAPRRRSLRSSRLAPPAWITIALTLWAMMSCSSRRSARAPRRSRPACAPRARRPPAARAHGTQATRRVRARTDRRTTAQRTRGQQRTGPCRCPGSWPSAEDENAECRPPRGSARAAPQRATPPSNRPATPSTHDAARRPRRPAEQRLDRGQHRARPARRQATAAGPRAARRTARQRPR